MYGIRPCCRGGTRLSAKSFKGLCVVGAFLGKECQSNVATELYVVCLVHHAHPAAAHLTQYSVMGNRLAHGLGGSGHLAGMLGRSWGEGQLAARLGTGSQAKLQVIA